MVLDDLWDFFQERVFPLPSSERLFNPFHDVDQRVDLPEGREIRRTNLFSYLSSFERKPSLLMIGEAGGSLGLPLFRHFLHRREGAIYGCSSLRGRAVEPGRAPHDDREKTPVHVALGSDILGGLAPPPPRFPGVELRSLSPPSGRSHLSVRTPDSGEIRRFLGQLEGLDGLLRPERIIASGRRAGRRPRPSASPRLTFAILRREAPASSERR